MEPPTMTRASSSIGAEGFAERLQLGLTAAGNGDVHSDFQITGIDEAEEFLQQAQNQLDAGPKLTSAPMQTQEAASDDEEEDDIDVAFKEEVNERFESLNAKTFRMRELLKVKMDSDAGEDPYELMQAMHDAVEAAPKDEDVVMFNTIDVMFETARSNPELLDFLARVFAAQQAYYTRKAKVGAATRELRALHELYDKQEEEVAMAALRRKQEQRAEQLANKVKASADKKAAKKAAKEAEPASKKAKKTDA